MSDSASNLLHPLQDEEEKKPSKSKDDRSARNKNAQPTAVVKSKLRNENREFDADAANRRKQHQKELAARRQEAGLEKYSEEGAGANGAREKQWRRFESYAREAQLPESVANQKVSTCGPCPRRSFNL